MIQNREPDPDPKLEEVARLLDQAAAQEALEMQEADALHSAPGLDRVEETLIGAWSSSDRSARERARMRWLGVLAAAAAVVLFILWRAGDEPLGDGPRNGPRGEYLGDATFEVMEPPERATRWDRIEWTGPAQATYRVRIRDGGTGELISGPLVQNARTVLLLNSEETVRWPKKIVIEVEMQRRDGTWTSAVPRESELQP